MSDHYYLSVINMEQKILGNHSSFYIFDKKILHKSCWPTFLDVSPADSQELTFNHNSVTETQTGIF
jgi:hypothetical protein